jgi:hypothetical protein
MQAEASMKANVRFGSKADSALTAALGGQRTSPRSRRPLLLTRNENKESNPISGLRSSLNRAGIYRCRSSVTMKSYQSLSTVLGAKPHLSPSLTPPSRETANHGCFGKEG